MQGIRNLLTRHFTVFAFVLALSLAMKAFVPAGFMIGSRAGHVLTVEICDSQGHSQLRVMALPDKPDPAHDGHAKAARDCPFTALSAHALSSADPVVLALALAFVLALGFRSTPPLRLARARYHRPPLRGPPKLS